MSAEMRVDLRQMDHRDVPRVAELDRAGFPEQWNERSYRLLFCVLRASAMVAVHDGLIVGMMVWEVKRGRLLLLRLTVSPAYRRKGLGTILIGQLVKLLGERRSTLIAVVAEENLGGQLFLRSCGLTAYSTIGDEDGCHYLFRLRVEDRCESGTCKATEVS